MLNDSLKKAPPQYPASSPVGGGAQPGSADSAASQAAIIEHYLRNNLTIEVTNTNPGYSLVELQVAIKLKGRIISKDTISFTT